MTKAFNTVNEHKGNKTKGILVQERGRGKYIPPIVPHSGTPLVKTPGPSPESKFGIIE